MEGNFKSTEEFAQAKKILGITKEDYTMPFHDFKKIGSPKKRYE